MERPDGLLYLHAFIYNEEQTRKKWDDLFKLLFWIGNICSVGFTNIIKWAGGKSSESIGEQVMPEEWKVPVQLQDKLKRKEHQKQMKKLKTLFN